MSDRRCLCCEQVFQPAPYHPQQLVCSRPECQRQRRRNYHRRHVVSDTLRPLPALIPDYRDTAEGSVYIDLRWHFDANRYYAPPRFVGQHLIAKAAASQKGGDPRARTWGEEWCEAARVSALSAT